ncbi:MAG: HAMP domain-containing histidine kinase [Oscillospiraceae bacterium]|jgi:signal transduction histidine kinase|nr:HAMP domain-containing histidine kinase [Oscillospiraceae bacterium]
MQKSIFSKYFRICATVVIASILVLGSLFLPFAAKYFTDEKMALLGKGAGAAQRIVLDNYQMNLTGTRVILDSSTIRQGFQMFSESTGAVIYFTDAGGATQLCSEDAPCLHTTYQIPEKVLQALSEEGRFFEMGKLEGLYKDAHYTMAQPVTLSGGGRIGYIFISTSAEELSEFLIQMLRIFLLSAVAVLLLAFVVTYYATAKMVRPLRQMSQAAKKFGQGDFSSRVEVAINDADDEIGQLAMAFNNMAQSLSASESMRRSFIANVSHELKTPMTSIAGFVDGILDGTIPREEQSRYLRIVSDEVKRLSRLVRSMLNLSRIEAGELKINATQFNIVEIICQTVFSFERTIDEKQLDVVGLDTDKIMVEADPDLLHQVVYNLTENAVKFVNAGGLLTFTFHVDGGMTYISIRNTGEGLSKEEIPRVFDRFYKTDRSRGMDKNGVGLGLYLVRSIITLHGGDIIVRSVKGEYTEFVFSVPTARAKNPALVKGKEKEYGSAARQEQAVLPESEEGQS